MRLCAGLTDHATFPEVCTNNFEIILISVCNADGASARVIEVQTPATTPTLYTIGDSDVTLDRTAMWIVKHSDGNVITNNCGVSIVALTTLEPFIYLSANAEIISIQTYDISYGDTGSP